MNGSANRIREERERDGADADRGGGRGLLVASAVHRIVAAAAAAEEIR